MFRHAGNIYGTSCRSKAIKINVKTVCLHSRFLWSLIPLKSFLKEVNDISQIVANGKWSEHETLCVKMFHEVEHEPFLFFVQNIKNGYLTVLVTDYFPTYLHLKSILRHLILIYWTSLVCCRCFGNRNFIICRYMWTLRSNGSTDVMKRIFDKKTCVLQNSLPLLIKIPN